MCKKYEVHSKKVCQVNMSFFIKIEASLAPVMLVLSILALSQFILVPSRLSGVVADYTLRKIYVSK